MNLYRKLRNIAWRASMKGLERGPHLSRYYMYHRLKAVGRQLPARSEQSRFAHRILERFQRLRRIAGHEKTEPVKLRQTP